MPLCAGEYIQLQTEVREPITIRNLVLEPRLRDHYQVVVQSFRIGMEEFIGAEPLPAHLFQPCARDFVRQEATYSELVRLELRNDMPFPLAEYGTNEHPDSLMMDIVPACLLRAYVAFDFRHR